MTELVDEYELDLLIDEIQEHESMEQCLVRLNDEVTIGNPLKGFWNPVEAARRMPVRRILDEG